MIPASLIRALTLSAIGHFFNPVPLLLSVHIRPLASRSICTNFKPEALLCPIDILPFVPTANFEDQSPPSVWHTFVPCSLPYYGMIRH